MLKVLVLFVAIALVSANQPGTSSDCIFGSLDFNSLYLSSGSYSAVYEGVTYEYNICGSTDACGSNVVACDASGSALGYLSGELYSGVLDGQYGVLYEGQQGSCSNPNDVVIAFACPNSAFPEGSSVMGHANCSYAIEYFTSIACTNESSDSWGNFTSSDSWGNFSSSESWGNSSSSDSWSNFTSSESWGNSSSSDSWSNFTSSDSWGNSSSSDSSDGSQSGTTGISPSPTPTPTPTPTSTPAPTPTPTSTPAPTPTPTSTPAPTSAPTPAPTSASSTSPSQSVSISVTSSESFNGDQNSFNLTQYGDSVRQQVQSSASSSSSLAGAYVQVSCSFSSKRSTFIVQTLVQFTVSVSSSNLASAQAAASSQAQSSVQTAVTSPTSNNVVTSFGVTSNNDATVSQAQTTVTAATYVWKQAYLSDQCSTAFSSGAFVTGQCVAGFALTYESGSQTVNNISCATGAVVAQYTTGGCSSVEGFTLDNIQVYASWTAGQSSPYPFTGGVAQAFYGDAGCSSDADLYLQYNPTSCIPVSSTVYGKFTCTAGSVEITSYSDSACKSSTSAETVGSDECTSDDTDNNYSYYAYSCPTGNTPAVVSETSAAAVTFANATLAMVVMVLALLF